MTYPIEIEIDDPHSEVIEAILTEFEWCVEEIGDHWKRTEDRIVHTADLDDLLADQHAIAIVWDIQHVKDQRPDLDDEQAWKVLQECQQDYERLNDPMLETIRQATNEMFPKLKGKAALRAQLAQIERRIEALPEDECTDPAAYGSVGAELDTVPTLMKGINP